MKQEHRTARELPPLPLDEWEDTKEALHRYCQIVGKVRMGLSPFKNHWWHATLYITTRGLSTGPIPYGNSISVRRPRAGCRKAARHCCCTKGYATAPLPKRPCWSSWRARTKPGRRARDGTSTRFGHTRPPGKRLSSPGVNNGEHSK